MLIPKKITCKFTLIELTVVLSVISILFTMTLSALSKVHQQAEQTLCAEKLKQVATANQLYTSDSGGWFPFPCTTWYTDSYLGHYIGASINTSEASNSPEFFICPSDDLTMDQRFDSQNKVWANSDGTNYKYLGISYGINAVLCGYKNNVWYTAHKTTSVINPSRCFLVADSTHRDINKHDRFNFRHTSKSNIVFVDGHIEAREDIDIPIWRSYLKQGFWLGGPDE